MDNVLRVLSAVNEELFPDGRQRPLGQSAGGQNEPLPQLQRVNNEDDITNNDNAADDSKATEEDDSNATNHGKDRSAEDNDATDDNEYDRCLLRLRRSTIWSIQEAPPQRVVELAPSSPSYPHWLARATISSRQVLSHKN